MKIAIETLVNWDGMSLTEIFSVRNWLVDITNGIGIQVSREEFAIVKRRMVEIDKYLKEKFLC